METLLPVFVVVLAICGPHRAYATPPSRGLGEAPRRCLAAAPARRHADDVPRRRIATAGEALELVRERGVLPLAPDAGSPASLVEAVAGERPRGSWWGHAAGGRIYALATALEDAPDVLVAKIVRGKVAFVHRALWPALLRVAADAPRAAAARAAASPRARALLEQVERDGEARLDRLAAEPGAPPERALAGAAKELEAAGLAHVSSVHTERGRHAGVVRTWRRAVRDAAAWREAERLDLAVAEGLLAARGASLGATSAQRSRALTPRPGPPPPAPPPPGGSGARRSRSRPRPRASAPRRTRSRPRPRSGSGPRPPR
jgi:hypothetical protein